jgi:hypothetical protein
MPADWEVVLMGLEKAALRPVLIFDRDTGRWQTVRRTLANVLTMLDVHELWHRERKAQRRGKT